MIEFELKFQIPPGRRDAVRSFVAGRGRPLLRPVDLQALYFDTPRRLLARAGIALRLRHEGAGWVQTLKGAATDGIGREEYNLTLQHLGDSRSPPDVDPRRHRDVPLGKRLVELLAADADPDTDTGLRCSYRSDVRRLLRQLKTRFGTVELAFDEGHLVSEGSKLEICELEIELISGHPMAVIDAARRWAPRFGLWLDTRSKAERGDLLARGERIAVAQSQVARTTLHEQHSPRAALQASIVAVRNAILANASQIASGLFDAEHVHQLRVMLRRLRVHLRLFADDPAAAASGRPLAAPAAELFRGLGAGRDRSVLAGPVSTNIVAALRQAGDDGEFQLPNADDADARMVELVRSLASQQLLLGLVEATLPAFVDVPSASEGRVSLAGAAPADAKLIKQSHLSSLLAKRLGHWQRSIARDAGKFDELDEAARHRLRKHVKRLRYAIEATNGLFDKRRSKAVTKPLKSAQLLLGDLNDLSTAIQVFGGVAGADHRAWFARGWLIAQQQTQVDCVARPMKRLALAMRKKRLR